MSYSIIRYVWHRSIIQDASCNKTVIYLFDIYDIAASLKRQGAIEELFIYSIYVIVALFTMQDAMKELFIYSIWHRSIIQDARCNKRVIYLFDTDVIVASFKMQNATKELFIYSICMLQQHHLRCKM